MIYGGETVWMVIWSTNKRAIVKKKVITDLDCRFEKGHTRFEIGLPKFCLFVKFQKPPKAGGLKMTEGSERVNVTVDRKHGGPPKVGDKSPKVGGPFEIGRYRFRCFIRVRA